MSHRKNVDLVVWFAFASLSYRSQRDGSRNIILGTINGFPSRRLLTSFGCPFLFFMYTNIRVFNIKVNSVYLFFFTINFRADIGANYTAYLFLARKHTGVKRLTPFHVGSCPLHRDPPFSTRTPRNTPSLVYHSP